jgi:hypothetical protein
MSHRVMLKSLCACAATATLFTVATAPAGAATSCVAPTLTEPFASFGDTNLYAIVPGESADDFAATGWTLSGGARLVTTTLDDGTSGQVLDLPGGAKAVSPSMCVTDAYSSARMMLKYRSGSAGITATAKYTYTSGSTTSTTVTSGAVTGAASGWSLSSVFTINSVLASGWQQAVFTLQNSDKSGGYQVYNLYIDPKQRN